MKDIDIEALLRKPLLKAGIVIQDRVKELCPVDTGELRGSIRVTVEGDSAYIGTSKEYFPYVEFGTGLFAKNGDGRQDVPWRYKDLEGNWHSTVGQKPQPFLENGFNETKEEATQVLTEEFFKELKNARYFDDSSR